MLTGFEFKQSQNCLGGCNQVRGTTNTLVYGVNMTKSFYIATLKLFPIERYRPH